MASNKTLSDLLSQQSISSGDIRYMSPEVKNEVESRTASCTGEMRERLYWLQHGLSNYPSCATCGSNLTSKNFRTNIAGGGYTLTCSVKCAKRNPTFSNKTKHVNLKKYSEHSIKSDEFKSTVQRDIIQTNIITGKTEASISVCEARKNVKCINAELALDVNRDILESVQLEWRHQLCGNVYISPITNGDITSCPNCNNTASILELSLRQMVIDILPDQEILFNVKNIIPSNEALDVYIPSKKLALTFNGIYWHNSIRDDYKFRRRRNAEACAKLGIKLIHIWEDHFLQKPDVIKSIIRNACGQSKKIGARECKVQLIASADANRFLTENHLNGYIKCKVNLGLILKDELVAVMSFGQQRFGNRESDSWELYRFASKNGIQIAGGASKLFKHFISLHQPKKIMSFADMSLGGGDVYLKIGMKEQETTPPGYFWASASSPARLSRFKTQKHKLKALIGNEFDDSLSEEANMKKIGWFKLWDCGNRKFTYSTEALS